MIATVARLLCFYAAAFGEAYRPKDIHRPRQANVASHRFSPYEAELFWSSSESHLRRELRSHSSLMEVRRGRSERPVRIMHLTDNHISVDDPDPPRTTRMFNAFAHTEDHATQQATSPKEEFVALLRKAKEDSVDLIALGGDLVNYPSPKTVAWVLQQLHEEARGIPFIYTAGNHDWHEEGITADHRYDSARPHQLNTTLRPLYEHSAADVHGAAGGRLYGKTSVRGVDVIFVDNSNHQVNLEQLRYLQDELQQDTATPAVLLMHMPLKLKGTPPLEPKFLCGHPAWGAATDELWKVEGRPQWPVEGNYPSTSAFIEMVHQHSAPAGRLAALLTGHVHRDFSAALKDASVPNAANLTALACGKDRPGCQLRAAMEDGTTDAMGALQYTTLDGAEGGYRLLTIHQDMPQHEAVQSTVHRLVLDNSS